MRGRIKLKDGQIFFAPSFDKVFVVEHDKGKDKFYFYGGDQYYFYTYGKSIPESFGLYLIGEL